MYLNIQNGTSFTTLTDAARSTIELKATRNRQERINYTFRVSYSNPGSNVRLADVLINKIPIPA